jgi:UDP-GlcNAc:undecaprenyl-phosphate GlcNAc-1-phosphate transferase
MHSVTKVTHRRYKILRYLVPSLVVLLLLSQYIQFEYPHLISRLVNFVIPGIVSFLLILIITPITIRIAKRVKAVVQPEYPKHKLPPIPLFGGLTIFLSMLFVLIFYLPVPNDLLSIMLAACMLLIIGTIDDVFPLSSLTRLIFQLLASCIIMSQGLIVSFMPDTLIGTVIAFFITLLWIIGIINATNFIDGIDGLAGGITLIVSIFFFLLSIHLEQPYLSLLTSTLAGCCLGFLVFNFKPAKIYLGDGGSTFLGFLLASFALYGGWSDHGVFVALGIPVLILGVLIFDMIYITISRIRNKHVSTFKEWLDYRGRDHFHHRLINIGFSEESAVMFIFIICIILGISALVLEHTRFTYIVILLLTQAILIFVITSILMLVGRDKKTHAPIKLKT